MREKYESLALTDLKEIAKARGIKGISGMKKADVVEAMIAEDAKEKAAETENREEKKTIPPRKAAAGKTTADNGRSSNAGSTGNSNTGNNANHAGVNNSGNYNSRKNYENNRNTAENKTEEEKYPSDLDSGIMAHGILEVMPDGYGFIRCENYLPGENDVYVAPSQIRRFNLKTGDILEGNTRIKTQSEKFSALLYVKSINGYRPDVATGRCNFEDMTPIFPNERLRLETQGASVAMRIMDLMSPVGKGQRGMIVSPPKAGKTTLLKEVAQSIKKNAPGVHLIILLIEIGRAHV